MMWRLIQKEKRLSALYGVASCALHVLFLWFLLVAGMQGGQQKSPKLPLVAIAQIKKSGPANDSANIASPTRFAQAHKEGPAKPSLSKRAQETKGKEQEAIAQKAAPSDVVEKELSSTSPGHDVRLFPRLLNGNDVDIPYPERAKQLMIEGVVRLRLTISEAGKVIHAEVISGPAFGLRSAALKVARKLFFLPATDEHGQARVEKVDHDVVFRLNRQS